MQDRDKFGFYQVDTLKFYSKFEAAELASKHNLPIQWNFNDNVFSLCDWSQEPNECLADIYRQRAEQLRSQYDYIVLWYSGGSDSKNILDAFVKNNIPLDEVASYVNIEATGDKQSWMNAEIYHVAIPTIAQVRDDQQPWLQHRVIDLSQFTMDYFSQRANRFDWIYNVNCYVSPNNLARANIVDHVPDWSNLINQGKQVAFVWGMEKPKVVAVNGQFSAMFFDTVDCATMPHHQHSPKPGLFNELFYWSPDLPKLPIKQAHVIKNFFKSVTADSPLLTDKYDARASTVLVDKKIKSLIQDGASKLLYPGWYPVPYQLKPPSLLFTPRDTWFFNLPDSDPAKQAWRHGLEHRWNTTPDFLKNDPNNIVKGFRYLRSRAYDLGP